MAKRWYVVHTYSGYENKVKADLQHRVEMNGLTKSIVDIEIPTEEVTEVKEGGQRSVKESKVLPSYVLVRMEMNDHTWSIVRNTPGVTGFVGADNNKPCLLRVMSSTPSCTVTRLAHLFVTPLSTSRWGRPSRLSLALWPISTVS